MTGEHKKMENQIEDVDEFELFCKLAGRRRRLSSIRPEYGGSLPCFEREPLSTVEQVSPATSCLISVTPAPNIRRTRSACMDGEEWSDSTPCSPRYLKSPSNLSPLKIWSSIKSLVDSCDRSPKCLSPTSPTLKVPKFPSAPHSRSPSIKKRKKPKHFSLELDSVRPRTSSMPTKNNLQRPTNLSIDSSHQDDCDSDDCYRVRNFVTTPKGIVNCGDFLRSKSTSRSSLRSLESCGSCAADGSLDNGPGCPFETEQVAVHRVLLAGAVAVGKTTLAQQFLTSQCLVELSDALNEFEECITVSVQLDEEEATMEIIELAYGEDYRTILDVDAYLLVFSTCDRSSFHHAVDILYGIRREQNKNSTVIMVANKTDLVRSRQVAEQEGKSVADTYQCKYIEVSALMDLKVDELLAGILNQIRLRLSQHHERKKQKKCAAERPRSPIAMIGRFLKRQARVSQSCDNLLVL